MCHFAQHAHDQKDEHTAECIAHKHAWTCDADGCAAADEDACPDDAAECNHGDVAWSQRMRKRARCRCSFCDACHQYCSDACCWSVSLIAPERIADQRASALTAICGTRMGGLDSIQATPFYDVGHHNKGMPLRGGYSL